MRVRNVHACSLDADPAAVGALLDALASAHDRLWPARHWPPMRLDRPLAVGARGGHGPIRYEVAAHEPGRRVRFRFTGPRGFDGHHEFEILGRAAPVVLRHTILMETRGRAVLSWPLVYRPLHDALLEDALAGARAAVGMPAAPRPWSPWVRLLRRLLARG